jgi:hypothetical protein
MAFEGAIEAHNGMLRPDPAAPGFGLTWKAKDMAPYRV